MGRVYEIVCGFHRWLVNPPLQIGVYYKNITSPNTGGCYIKGFGAVFSPKTRFLATRAIAN